MANFFAKVSIHSAIVTATSPLWTNLIFFYKVFPERRLQKSGCDCTNSTSHRIQPKLIRINAALTKCIHYEQMIFRRKHVEVPNKTSIAVVVAARKLQETWNCYPRFVYDGGKHLTRHVYAWALTEPSWQVSLLGKRTMPTASRATAALFFEKKDLFLFYESRTRAVVLLYRDSLLTLLLSKQKHVVAVIGREETRIKASFIHFILWYK